MPDATVRWRREDALFVDSWEFQSRQAGGDWSGSLSALPEPDLTLGLAMCAIILIWLAGNKWGGGYYK